MLPEKRCCGKHRRNSDPAIFLLVDQVFETIEWDEILQIAVRHSLFVSVGTFHGRTTARRPQDRPTSALAGALDRAALRSGHPPLGSLLGTEFSAPCPAALDTGPVDPGWTSLHGDPGDREPAAWRDQRSDVAGRGVPGGRPVHQGAEPGPALPRTGDQRPDVEVLGPTRDSRPAEVRT